MFKKSLLALAFAGAAMSASAATTLSTSLTNGAPFAVSNQGLPVTGEYNLAATGSIDVTIAATESTAMKTGNFLVLTIEGAYFADYEVSGEAYNGNGSTGVIATVNGITLQHVATTSTRKNSATKIYLETRGTVANGAIATKFSIDDFNLQVITGSTAIKLTAAVENESGIVVTGTETSAVSVATLQDQWTLKVSPTLDAKIDVADDRETFVGNVKTDALKLDYTQNGTGAVISSTKVTLKGDFTGIATVVGGAAYVINTAKTEATRTITGNVNVPADETITFTLDSGAKAVAQTERKFTVDIESTYDTSKTFAIATDKAVGGWTLNSTSTTVNFVPFGPNTQLIVNATSTFSEPASVDITYVNTAGKSVTLTDIATVAPKAVTKLGDVIANAIIADDGQASGKTKVTVSVNAPTGTVTYFTGFKDKVDGSRMALEQVDTSAADAANSAAANNTLLKDSSTGLAQLSTDIAANGTTNTNAAYLAAARSAVVTGATPGTVTTEEKAQADAICNLGTTNGGYSQGAGTVADAVAITGTCI